MTEDLAKLFADDKPTPELQQKIKEFRKLIIKERKLKAELEEAESTRIIAEATLYAIFENTNFQLIKTENGTFSRTDRFFANIAPGKKEEGYAWLKELGFGDLIHTTVNANTFSAFVKDLKKSDIMLELPDFINTGIRKKISVTGLKKEK